jgi:hypothetical protein
MLVTLCRSWGRLYDERCCDRCGAPSQSLYEMADEPWEGCDSCGDFVRRLTVERQVRYERSRDPAYRILREQHRRSWLAAMRTIRGALARWLP